MTLKFIYFIRFSLLNLFHIYYKTKNIYLLQKFIISMFTTMFILTEILDTYI